jgi:glycosyltransferase involved in cell wall biosynthesis
MPIRVLHCPTDTGRNAWTLAQAEKRLGLESTVLVYHSTWLNYPNDIDLDVRSRSRLGKVSAIGGLLLRAARDYDVIHFNAGRSLMPASQGGLPWLSRADLAYFHMLGKGIVVTYQGCDVRQRTACESRFEVNACAYCTTACSPELDRHKQHLVEGFDKYADAIFSLNPDLLWVLPERAEFLPYTTIDLDEWVPEPPQPSGPGEPFRILHAPTNRGLKGTPQLLEAVEQLKAEYPEVELLLVENMPHDEVMEQYRRAHVVVDQLLLGWYGGFAVEAMALGRPVVCYIRDDDLRFIPEAMRAEIPVVSASPADILEVLRGLVRDRERLPELGARSRTFVEHWHDPDRIAERTKATYERILARTQGAPVT